MLVVLLNLFFAWWMWRVATDHFEAGSNALGWFGIVLSAFNAAAALNHLV